MNIKSIQGFPVNIPDQEIKYKAQVFKVDGLQKNVYLKKVPEDMYVPNGYFNDCCELVPQIFTGAKGSHMLIIAWQINTEKLHGFFNEYSTTNNHKKL